MADSLSSVRTDLSLLSKDVVTIINTQDRIDSSIDKLTDISNNIAKLVSVYGSKLDSHEETIKTITTSFEKKKDDSDRKFDVVKNEIQKLEKEMVAYFNDKEEKMNKSFLDLKDALTKEINERDEQVETKILSLQKFQWMLLGGGAVAGALSSGALQVFLKVFLR